MDPFKLNNVVKEVTDNMGTLNWASLSRRYMTSSWDEFCDWYIEMVKPRAV